MESNRPDMQDDEFDVELFVKRLYHLTGKIVYKLMFPFRVLFASTSTLLIFITGAFLIALLLRFTLPPVYSSSFLIKPINRSDLYFLNLIHAIHTLVKDGDDERVAAELGLDTETAESITKIYFTPIRPPRTRDSVDAVEITIVTKDVNSFDKIQNSLINYIENNPYYAKNKAARLYEIAQVDIKLKKDILEIDSLKILLATNIQPRGNGGFVYGEPIDPVRVYEEGFNLFRQQIGLNWQKEFINNFELVKPCVVSKKPYFPRMATLLPFCFGLSLILCFIYNYRKLYLNKPVTKGEQPHAGA